MVLAGGVADDPDSLLTRCRTGDPAAWDEVVERYERLVFSVARRNGLSREDAADVTQATFVAMFESLDRIRDDDRLASWLMTVSRRQSWAWRNRAQREELRDEEVGDRPGDVDALANWESLTLLHTALDRLGQQCRTLLHALYLDPVEPSYREIADRLQVRPGGIGAMRARCLRKLRGALGEEAF